jgi:membrane-bound metal-dependent hydrolase YbcI (DUF457 family)
MMSPTHSLSGAALFLAAAPWLHLGSPAEVAVGAVCAAGAAMLPDMDQHTSSPARAFGLASRALAWLVGKLSGGHRHATHSLLGIGVFTGLATAATHHRGWPLIVLLTMLAGMAIRGLGPRPRDKKWRLDYADIAGFVHAAAAGWLANQIVNSSMDLQVVPWAVAIGVTAHIAGDLLTPEGCPLFWPWLEYYNVAEITTDSWVEKWVVTTGLYLALGFIAYRTWGSWSPAISTIIARS